MLNDFFTIALITDFHYGNEFFSSRNKGLQADALVTRAVSRLNRQIRPDVTLVLGDIVDADGTSGTDGKLRHMHSILEKLESPYIAIPGNHDSGADTFYKFFSRPGDYEDIGGVRFVPFVDREEPGCNASRSSEDLKRLLRAGSGFKGPIVSMQHFCLFPPGSNDTPFNYTNSPEVIKVMKDADVLLSLSGHRHEGIETMRDGNITFINAPGLCVEPFPITVVTVDEKKEITRNEIYL